MIRPSETLVGTHLNSVWLEGTLDEDPVDQGGPEKPLCLFPLRTLVPRDGESGSVFQIEAPESALFGCRSRLTRGRPVRIIGRLRQQRNQTTIVGELVEAMVARV